MKATLTQTADKIRNFGWFSPGSVIRRDDGTIWLRGLNSAVRLKKPGAWDSWDWVVEAQHVTILTSTLTVTDTPPKYHWADMKGRLVGQLSLDLTGAA